MKTPEELAQSLHSIYLSWSAPTAVGKAVHELTAWRDECMETEVNALVSKASEWCALWRRVAERYKEEADAANESCRMMQERLQRLVDAGKPTVPMAMLSELNGPWFKPELKPIVKEQLCKIAAKYGYEVSE